ncbi:MAG: DEAD/DEAH box helicase [Verrucomicrobiaceae bacterium]|nr:MAG: DEAD/DEAH box helicase [Verrucomicrobiaceae bacterium]
MPFTALGLEARIVQAVQEAGYTEPTPIQAAAIPVILAGTDVIGIAQTGTGKTAAFTLPLLTRMTAVLNGRPGTKALILAPTRELAVQIEENVRIYGKHLNLRIATVFGGVGERPQIQSLRSGVDMIIACPGRLLDLLGQGHGDFSGIEYLVLDEADRMLDMGFLPSIRRIVRGLPGKRQTLLFSATLSKEIESLTQEFQRSPKTVQVGRRSNPAETVAQWVYEVPAHLKPGLLAHLLEDPVMNSVLVFTRTKHGADRISKRLEQSGISCGTLHSNRSQNQRLKALKDFRDGAVRVLVATDIAARGIDVDGISHVVNYDFPPHAEDYVHRIGRTGRAQAIGDAISFVSGDDQAALRSLEKFIGRGILRKKAENFDLSAPAPPRSAEPPVSRGPRPQNRRSGGGAAQGGGARGGQRQGAGSGGGSWERNGPQPAPRGGSQPSRPRREPAPQPAQESGGSAGAEYASGPGGRRSRRR